MRRLMLAVVLIAACDNASTLMGPGGSFLVVSGDGQSGTVGQQLATPLVVKATDSQGRPQKNVHVNFEITSGGGSASPASVRTDRNGLAQTQWTLGTSVTQAQRLEARAGSTLLGAFSATPLPGPAAQLAIQSGDGQSAAHNTAVAVAPSVVVRDQYGNGVPGASVTFAVTAGGGSVTGSPAISGSTGNASVGAWTLGSTLGSNALQVSVPGVTPVAFSATATAGPPASMVLHAGNNQSAQANTNVPIPPAVRIIDAAGNPVSGVWVTFVPILGGNFTSPDTVQSGVDGVATASFWLLGPRTGTNTMRVTAPGITDTVVFTATAVSGPVDPDHSAIAAVPDKITTSTSSRVYVIARSAINNPVPGATVTFAATGAGNTIIQPTGPTDSSGYAEGQLRSTVLGQKVVSAIVNGIRITPTWTVTVQGGPPSQLSASAGNNQSAPVNTNVPTPPALLIRDANGNPVPDVIATFVVTQGGGSVGGSWVQQVASGQDGVAAVSSWRLGTTVGTNKLRATVQGVSDSVMFTATAIAGPPAAITIRAGNNQVGFTNTALPTSPSVIVKDGFNNVVAGATVTFAITEGNGAITGANPVTTDVAGIATVGGWVLGPATGTNRLTATVNGLTPVTFVATAPSGPPAAVEVFAGNNQSGFPNTALPIRPAVRVLDAAGNPVAVVRVLFAVTSGDGDISGSHIGTNSNGVATSGGWTLGPAEGVNTLSATVDWEGVVAGNPVTFTATAMRSAWMRHADVQYRFALGAAEANGTLYAVGGFGCCYYPFEKGTLEAYDLATDTWTERAPMPTPRLGVGVATINGRMYVVGGEQDVYMLGTLEVYDPTTNTWTTKAPMPTPRSFMGVAVVDGILYAIGGAACADANIPCQTHSVATVEAYDPVTDTWTTRAAMPTARQSVGAAAANGRIYAVGGAQSDRPWNETPSIIFSTNEEYDPATDSWVTKAPMPTARYGASVATLNGAIHAIGGDRAGPLAGTHEAFDPAANAWITRQAMPTPRFWSGVAVVAGRIFVVGGNGAFTAVESYQP